MSPADKIWSVLSQFDVAQWMALAWVVIGGCVVLIEVEGWLKLIGYDEAHVWRIIALYGFVTVLAGRVIGWW